jgi:hypothetical protein
MKREPGAIVIHWLSHSKIRHVRQLFSFSGNLIESRQSGCALKHVINIKSAGVGSARSAISLVLSLGQHYWQVKL